MSTYGSSLSSTRSVALSRDAEIIIAACEDGTIWRWDCKENIPVKTRWVGRGAAINAGFHLFRFVCLLSSLQFPNAFGFPLLSSSDLPDLTAGAAGGACASAAVGIVPKLEQREPQPPPPPPPPPPSLPPLQLSQPIFALKPGQMKRTREMAAAVAAAVAPTMTIDTKKKNGNDDKRTGNAEQSRAGRS